MKKIASSNLSSLNIFLKNGKIPLSPKSNKDLIHKNPINYFPKFNRRKSSTNLYNDINILKSSLKNPIKYSNRENKINNVNISSDLNTSRSSNEESKNNIYENYAFQLTNNGKMNKIYLELINSDLYIYSNETKNNLIEMHNLKGSIIRDYILENEVIIFNKEKYYSFEIISRRKIINEKRIIETFSDKKINKFPNINRLL